MKRRGFTLIELLAVIVILAVIALIATPMILNVIETARKGAAESSALGYLDAIEKQIMLNQLDSSATEITDGTYNLPINGISVKGELPSEGWVIIENSQVVDYSITIMDYNVTFENGKMVVNKGEAEEIIEAESVTISGDSELIGRTIQLTATVLPEDTTDKTVTWRSSNEEIATVSSNGLVSGVSDGIVTITATTTNGKEIMKEMTISMPVCIRALELHTEECTQIDTTYYCSGAGYTTEGSKGTTTITYGNLGIEGEDLVSGDAFDCDVDGSKTYDEDERFYYVSDYYNTNTKEFEADKAVLIYYNNTSVDSNGNIQPDNTDAGLITYYSSVDENWHGPSAAITNLPKTSDWTNVSLNNTSRLIINELGGTTTNNSSNTIQNPFSYTTGSDIYAARLLTTQELESACDMTVGSLTVGELDNCNYLLENSIYSSSTRGTFGYWLETPRSSSSVDAWMVDFYARIALHQYNVATADNGVRPVIEVLKTDIQI